ncbi:GTP pyrophosphokinase [Lapidilactobacillus gannanensis]|jgi:putative GTP pyrophosphokinase|uniref:GTP pyrophosphokinase family protein n=1 Tax=Lapidilactobacillus gannanensis TaxID=2486002 RepID=A0ABW4BRC1_9LACO|nr:GTP pyrophosphokinase family protein [Lapidilactobacillus gannanensis]MCH4056655.1 GTP pyrophosphokinase family protein [Lactobacillaceae bacterium]
MIENWSHFLMPYSQAVDELKLKFRAIRQQYQTAGEHSPIEFVTGRVKPVGSIQEKMKRRFIREDVLETDMQDIAGLRIMCQFVEDIYQVADLLRQRDDMTVIEERDYVSNSKPSGYRSYHIVIEYPIQMLDHTKKVLVEVQVRTLSMNFWATIEHSLNYKYNGAFPEDISARLKRAAEASFMLDQEMSEIREEIQEAQRYAYGHKLIDSDAHRLASTTTADDDPNDASNAPGTKDNDKAPTDQEKNEDKL